MHKTVLLAALVALTSVSARDRKFTIVNHCKDTMWTGIFNTIGGPNLTFADGAKTKTTGFALPAGASKTLTAPERWGGRIWPRTKCKQQGGMFVCESGNCEGTDENCGTTGQTCTLGEWTLAPEHKPEGDPAPDADWYDLSLVDGFNVPMQITPSKLTKQCPNLTCSNNLLETCPKELLAYGGSVCSSACKVGIAAGKYTNPNGDLIDGNRNCCTGPYDVPGSCRADMVDYYHVFKESCPDAYAHAYDDDKSLQQCPKSVQPDYTITFCPAPAPSFEEQIAALGGRTDAPKQPATPPASQNAEQPAKQPVEQPTTPAAAQPAAGQPQKRASLLATNVCVPPGFTLVSGGGDVKPQGECIAKGEEASPPTDGKSEPPADAPPVTPETPPASGTPDQPGQEADKAQANANGDTAAASPPANNPPASGNAEDTDQTQGGTTGAANTAEASKTDVPTGDASKTDATPPVNEDSSKAAHDTVDHAGTPGQPAPQVPPAGQPGGEAAQASGGLTNTPDVKTAEGTAGNAPGGTPPATPPTPPGAEGSSVDAPTATPGDFQSGTSDKHPCMGKKRHAGMKRLEDDPRM